MTPSSARSDSLGIVFWEVLSGSALMPFEAEQTVLGPKELSRADAQEWLRSSIAEGLRPTFECRTKSFDEGDVLRPTSPQKDCTADVSDPMMSLVSKMWSQDVAARPQNLVEALDVTSEAYAALAEAGVKHSDWEWSG
jgi:hypothetical protein